MKSKNDPRHQQRIKSIQALFAWGITGNLDDDTISPVIGEISKIDDLIKTAAPKWPIEQINKVELAILRYAIWELKNQPQTPPKVIIDEAIEISKEFCDTNSSAFVNAVLGNIYKKQNG
ncbi:MAG: N utilization substance protein B-like protein [Candidatus Shapirobacteria bacterium GW2011_GWE1_38_10]|uniref:N utilization substance protein B-like protein n=1 Tax=Candidatus Shapirobacteria bacterium GW2011_GWE1_38_10 TaxID=1618488 RepID=A0A0G0I728_9BACT|nr:MAG: N utilization substance protein B-like protein [Candidatus Shapirobacteria bacterium GW2011_GWF2_37_20]KKQ50352.1 MAG: N utilization substance protein B-like protein [Candidatus Shapirobacteria bacterium GW2011_GWE1_38_10]KKQ65175.1 MAG: N utilization substance protein B-like protein [Candidatus Shapirobacteria bacterium GW2011_GWF1_38_23]HBP50966.1 transcription antitermination factor NusB [Candidatus Shapirobacteria bacterium]